MTGYEKVHRVLCVFILLAASAATVATLAMPFEDGTKAPLLAWASGLFILTGIIPRKLPEPDQILGLLAPFLGTLTALGTAWYWLNDATGGDVSQSLYLVAVVATLILFYLAMLTWWVWILVTLLRSRAKTP